jgi:hypothetical protein
MWRRGMRLRTGSGAADSHRLHADARVTATDSQLLRAAFVAVLRAHPEALTFDQLSRELFATPYDFLAGYALACAVRELVMDGLLQSNGLCVAPTRSALFFAALEAEL